MGFVVSAMHLKLVFSWDSSQQEVECVDVASVVPVAAGRSPATCLMCLAIAFELSIIFANCQTLLAENFCMSTLPSFIVLVTKSSFLHEEPENVPMEDFGSFQWVFC